MGTVMGFTHTFDRETPGTMLFISEEEEVAIPQYDELFKGFSHVLTSSPIVMFPCFCEVTRRLSHQEPESENGVCTSP